MKPVNRIQSGMHAAARVDHEAVAVSGFTIYFHKTRAGRTFSYAIPTSSALQDPRGAVERMREEFSLRSRALRIEFVEACAPALSAALEREGLRRTEALPFLFCTRETLRTVSPAPGLEIVRLAPSTPLLTFLEFQRAQAAGFEQKAGFLLDPEEVAELQSRSGEDGFYLARMEGTSAAVGMFARPLEGSSEVLGIATLPAFRGHGIAGALTANVTRDAFQAGADLTYLTASGEAAAKIYTRVGYMRYGEALVYEDRD